MASTTETQQDDALLRPFFGYFGGKWRDAPRNYPAPEFDTIVEPFAGSAGYSLRYPSRNVVLCEADPILAAVWDFLIRAKPSEIRAIPDLAADETVDSLKVTKEAKWLVGFWLNRGVASPRRKPSKWMRDRIRPGSFWGERVRETIASQVDSIRHWKIYECDYRKCPTDRKATWFIDPPYEVAGKYYRYGSSLIDYDALALWCQTRKGQVIVCENEGATWLPFTEIGAVKTTRAGIRSKEVFWVRSSKPNTAPWSANGHDGAIARQTNGATARTSGVTVNVAELRADVKKTQKRRSQVDSQRAMTRP